MNKVKQNLLTGVEWGLYFAAVFVAVATLVVVFRGVDLKGEYNMSYVELVLVYVFGGLTGGVTAGLLLPLCRWRVGTMLVGFVAILPFAFVLCYLLVPRSEWGSMIPLLPMLGSAIAGPLGALAIQIGIETGRGRY